MNRAGMEIAAAETEALFSLTQSDAWPIFLGWLDNNLQRCVLDLFNDGRKATTETDIKSLDRLRGRDELIRDVSSLKVVVESRLDALRLEQEGKK